MSKNLRVWLSSFFILCTALGFTQRASADDAGPLSIGGRGTYFAPKDGSGAWDGGAQVRLRLPLFFAVEGSVDYRRNHLNDNTTIHDWPVQLSAIMYVLPKIIVVQPFILGGYGWYHSTVEGPNGFSDTQTNSGPHLGAGVEFNLNSHWFIDGTYRYIWLDKIHTQNANQANEDLRQNSHMATVGLNYRF